MRSSDFAPLRLAETGRCERTLSIMAAMAAGIDASIREDALPTVSVVIPTRNRRASLERALAGFRADGALREVIVVDDHSDDDTLAWLATEVPGWPELKVLRTSGLGPSAARAAGVAQASGDVVLFLDDDEVPMQGLASAHARHHREREDLVVCGYYPIVVPSRPSAVLRVLARWYDEGIDFVAANPDSGLFRLWGGNFSMRRKDLARVPLAVAEFEGLKAHEDQEFGLRCLKAGFGYVLDRDLRAEHFYTRSLKQFRADGRQSGHCTVLIHWLHGDLVGPVPSEVFESQRAVLLRFLRLTDRAVFYRLATSALSGLVLAADALRIDKIGESCVRLLHRVERRRGVIERTAWLESRPESPGID